ncbi:MAG: AAA family ATPase [bacterium]|nr:AAA family ATPase [bacterium]
MNESLTKNEKQLEMEDFEFPKWTKEIIRFINVKPQIILEGNIYDIYPIEINIPINQQSTNPTNTQALNPNINQDINKNINQEVNQNNDNFKSDASKVITTMKLVDYLATILNDKEGYELVVLFEPIFGFKRIKGSEEVFKKFIKDAPDKEGFVKAVLFRAYEAIENMVNSKEHYVSVIVNFASRLPEVSQNDINEFLYKMFRLSFLSNPKIIGNVSNPKYNPVFILIDKETDLPAWYTLDNPKVKIITVPKPDNVSRKVVIKSLIKRLDNYNELVNDEKKYREILDLFIDQTYKMYNNEIISIVSLAKKEGIDVYNINEAIRRYKVGVIDNPWAKLSIDNIINAEEILKKRVKGQDKAIKRAVEILRRSFYNLSGSQFGVSTSRPKGVMFFAGPTGVGKTELAKALTELIFGSESNYIRFDMSEYSKEHTDQRLIGAPPGYVGYDAGGQLTNAIKQNPFSIVLFDEIEKAHPRILDIFLQILDEGRLTSGRGETVYFTECIIIFTSNLGIYDIDNLGNKIVRVDPSMEYDLVEKQVKDFIVDYFKFRLNRPEILNRIGENIIVFDFIRPYAANLIFDKMINNIIYRLKDNNKIELILEDQIYNILKDYCVKDLSMGGRGIGNKLEIAFVNPLSTLLFKLQPKEGDSVVINDIKETYLGWELNGYIK